MKYVMVLIKKKIKIKKGFVVNAFLEVFKYWLGADPLILISFFASFSFGGVQLPPPLSPLGPLPLVLGQVGARA